MLGYGMVVALVGAAAETGSGDRLRRLSGLAAITRCAPAGVPASSTTPTPCSAAAPTSSGRVNLIATSLPGVLDRDPALAGKTTTGRHADAPGDSYRRGRSL